MLLSLVIGAEDGSELWLRFLENKTPANVQCDRTSATARIAVEELSRYWTETNVRLVIQDADEENVGFRVERFHQQTTITAHCDLGLLYGAYSLLMRSQMTCKEKSWQSSPAFSLRLLNHWDNPDGSIERGYAGRSIWRWEEIDERHYTMSQWMEEHVRQYARANASIGINGAVLNNVNAKAVMLSPAYIGKVKVLADALRPYGIRVFLSVNFASPMMLDGLKTADPLNQKVIRWWQKKIQAIYKAIPDFGGFLVKANSEGQPGPGDYGRSHADGANMLADALKPYKGIVMWRSFVYGNHEGEDRVMQAVTEFQFLDGQFHDNVILQSQNGPLDFQPREPYAPIFDTIKKTDQIAELQITQEYLGQSIHLVYLAPMWTEFFHYVDAQKLKGIAGVSNIGDDNNWCGHHFSQANWYAFGRLAWNPELTAEQIADEWLQLTFCASFIPPTGESCRGFDVMGAASEPYKQVRRMMLSSREACVDYMMPMGLHHIFHFDHHYGPQPDGFNSNIPIYWCPAYFVNADSMGIGFDRSSRGTNAVNQYREPYRSLYDNLETCPEDYLLWFHHVPWTYRTKSGLQLIDELQRRYDRGVAQVESYLETWRSVHSHIDEQRWKETEDRLKLQLENACEWRKVCMDYFLKNYNKSF